VSRLETISVQGPRAIALPDRPRLRLWLLGGFRFEIGHSITISEGSQRVLALLALWGRPVRRTVVAGTLWPEATEAHASSSLRSALARLHRGARAAVTVTPQDLELAPDVEVDLRDAEKLAQQLLDSEGSGGALGPVPDAISALSGDLLPDWDDEWVLVQAEDWRQLRLHALEALADRLIARQRYADAAAAALAAIRADTLRESARAALIRVHRAEGNLSEAVREFARYRDLLHRELGVEPTDRLRALVPAERPAIRRSGIPA
jgi:DNA-binding SARP family transcriptional activator